MGCGGSKDEIVAGNTVAVKSLQSNKPLSPNSSTIQSSEQKPSISAIDSVDSEKKETNTAEALISRESPDRYFSSRKDEEAIAGVNVLNKDEDRLLADSVSVVEDSAEVKKECLIGGDGEAKIVAEVDKSEDEKGSAEGGKDSKGASVEEKVSDF